MKTLTVSLDSRSYPIRIGSGLIDKKIVVAEDWDQLSQKTKEFIQVIAAARQDADKS